MTMIKSKEGMEWYSMVWYGEVDGASYSKNNDSHWSI